MANFDWKFGLKCSYLNQLAAPKTNCGQVRFLKILLFGLISYEKKTYYIYYSIGSLYLYSDFTDFVGRLTWENNWQKRNFNISWQNLPREQTGNICPKP